MIVFPPAARFRRAAAVGVLCAGLALAATGCGEDLDKGTNGVGKLPADEIEGKARAAATAADAVRLSGTVVTGGKTFTLDMRLTTDGASGEVKTTGSTFELLRVGDELYLKADAAFWGRKPEGATGSASPRPGESGGTDGSGEDGEGEGEAAADKLGDKFVKVPAGDSSYKQLRGFTEMDVLLDGLLGLHGKLAKGSYRKVGTVRTIEVTADEGAGGRLDVSLLGTPYPLRLERAGGAGVVELKDWDKPFPLKAPPEDQTVDYGPQLPSRG